MIIVVITSEALVFIAPFFNSRKTALFDTSEASAVTKLCRPRNKKHYQNLASFNGISHRECHLNLNCRFIINTIL